MRVAIATQSRDKISGILGGFSDFFQMSIEDINLIAQSVCSGVPDQPFDLDTFAGAKNRIEEVRRISDDVDFYVSCEAGIETFGDLFFNVQVVCIYDAHNHRYLWGKSSGWNIPSKDIGIIKEIGLDSYLRQFQHITSIDQIFGGRCSREASVKEATWLALCSSRLA